MEDKKYWMWLSSIPGVGSRRFFALMDYFESAENIFAASDKELQASHILPAEVIKSITENRKRDKVDNYYKKVKDNGIKVYTILENEYPEYLKNIYDAPPLVYVKGELLPQDSLSMGIVGSRKASEYGVKTAERLAGELAQAGMTIVSGMAMGIDSAAHRGALKAGGRTVAVLGCGLNHIYPRSSTGLFREIAAKGAIVTEYPLGMAALPKNFVARNRLISGMSRGVLVVEAGERSGSLITADFALEQGREVFAVPGNINSPNSKGTNALIKNGAKLVQRIEDIFEELNIGFERPSNDRVDCRNFDAAEKAIMEVLGSTNKGVNDIISETGYPPGRIMSSLTMLELKGIIQSDNGLYYINHIQYK